MLTSKLIAVSIKNKFKTSIVIALATLLISYGFVPMAIATTQNPQNNSRRHDRSAWEGRRTRATQRKMSLDVADSVDSQKNPGSSDPLVRVIVQTNKSTGWRERSAMMNSR